MATEIGERFARVRSVLSLSQMEFARKLGVSRSYLSEVENGKGKPSIEMVVGVATYFPLINIDWLLTGDGQETRQDKVPLNEEWPAIITASNRSILLEDTSEGRAINEIGWPLTSPQERMLTSFVPVPPLPGELPFANPFTTDFDKMWQRYQPYALSRTWMSEALRCAPEAVYLHHFKDDLFSPLIPRGSHGVVCAAKPGFQGPGFYWVSDDSGRTRVLLLIERSGHRISVASGNPAIPSNCFEIDEQGKDITALGQIVWICLSPTPFISARVPWGGGG